MKKRKATAILMAAVMATGVFSVIGTPVTAKADEDPVTVKWLMFGDKPEDYDMVMEDLNQKIRKRSMSNWIWRLFRKANITTK